MDRGEKSGNGDDFTNNNGSKIGKRTGLAEDMCLKVLSEALISLQGGPCVAGALPDPGAIKGRPSQSWN